MILELDQVLIRNIKAGDTSAVSKIEKECFSKPWSEKMIEEKLENSTSIFIVAQYQGEIIAYIGASDICGECYIDNIAVTQKFRRKGIAKLILTRCIEKAEEKNCEFITLEVRKSNEKAQNLYQMAQFERIGERKNYYSSPTENAVIMTRYFKSQEEI